MDITAIIQKREITHFQTYMEEHRADLKFPQRLIFCEIFRTNSHALFEIFDRFMKENHRYIKNQNLHYSRKKVFLYAFKYASVEMIQDVLGLQHSKTLNKRLRSFFKPQMIENILLLGRIQVTKWLCSLLDEALWKDVSVPFDHICQKCNLEYIQFIVSKFGKERCKNLDISKVLHHITDVGILQYLEKECLLKPTNLFYLFPNVSYNTRRKFKRNPHEMYEVLTWLYQHHAVPKIIFQNLDEQTLSCPCKDPDENEENGPCKCYLYPELTKAFDLVKFVETLAYEPLNQLLEEQKHQQNCSMNLIIRPCGVFLELFDSPITS